jgi:8-oxo-dGTP diphosphatase
MIDSEYAKIYLVAGALLFDHDGRFLLVKPHYREAWEIPGGIGEADESPREACRREVREELGLELDVGAMLVVDYSISATAGAGFQFIFDGGVLSEAQTASITLQASELTEWRFVGADEVMTLAGEKLGRRVMAALGARERGAAVYLEHQLP